MIYKIVKIVVLFVLPSLFLVNSVWAVSAGSRSGVQKSTQSSVVQSRIGLDIKEWGIAVDAVFNPELDGIIPKYHVFNIVLINRSGSPIELNVEEDKWTVTDKSGKKHTAYNHVSQFDKKLWETLPPKLQSLLDYPPMVNQGKSTQIDVFFPASVDLNGFKEISWKSSFFDKTFNLMTNYEDQITIPNEKEFDVPPSSTAIDLYKQNPVLPFSTTTTDKTNPTPQTDMQNQDASINDKRETLILNLTEPKFDPKLDETVVIQ